MEPLAKDRSHLNTSVQNYADNFLDDFNQHTIYVVSEGMRKEIYNYPIEEKGKPIAIDPHKGLFHSYGIGAILIKDIGTLYETHCYT